MIRKRPRTGGTHAALQAAISLAFVMPAAAQPVPNARPQGGQVVAGNAAIANGATTTTINQSTNRAAIDWRSFDVGSGQSVIFNQPGANSITLNRVTGPDPSAIAGRISANGQLVLTNPSGVVFHAGAQVNAQSVIVSAPGITNQNFMAGRMVFDQAAHPNARIENAGTITVKQAGLAALVAPSVANSGTITARMGHVVLAGAAAHTLDMYGDGLVSIDVTKQVTQAPVGPGGKQVTALVTNTGTIAADGGTVQLTARAADGVVNTLVQAGGRIQANTAGGRAGQIEIAGTGGSVVIEGRVAADGRAPGTVGGSVVVAGSEATIVAPTARVTANGRAGGGTVAVGTTLARARSSGPAPAGTSARAVIAAGAHISADAKASGNGGRVTVLSTQSTNVAGTLTAKGGRTAGDGGTIELSGETGFRLTGKADTSAPHGALGTIVLDPRDLTITDTPSGTNAAPTNGVDPNIGYAQGGTTTDAYVTPAQIEALTGDVRLQATRDLVVASSVSYGGGESPRGNLTLEAGRNLTVNSGVTITLPVAQGQPGIVTLSAASSNIPGYDPAGTLTIQGNITTSLLVLNSGSGGIVLGGTLDTTNIATPNAINATRLTTTGAVVQTAGTLMTGDLSGTATSVSLTSANNQIAGIGSLLTPLTTSAGGVSIIDSVALTVGNGSAGSNPTGIIVPTGQTISLTADTLTLQSGAATVPALSAPGGTVTLQPFTAERNILLTTSESLPSDQLTLTTAELGLIRASTLQLAGNSAGVTFGQQGDATIDLVANGGFAQLVLTVGGDVSQNASLSVNALVGSAGMAVTPVNVSLGDSGNNIPSISNLSSLNDVVVTTSGNLMVSGQITGNSSIQLTAGNDLTALAGSSIAGPVSLSAGNTNSGGTLTLAGTVASTFSGTLSSGTGGILMSGALSFADTVSLFTGGAVTQTGGSLSAGTLLGAVGSVSLPSRGNAIGTITGTTVSSGDFLLVDQAQLTVSPVGRLESSFGLALPAGHTATLVTDYLTLSDGGYEGGRGTAIAATGGTLAVAPYTAGGAVLLTSGDKPQTGLSLTTAELGLVDAATLQLGGTGGLPVAGAITVGQGGDAAIDLGALGFTRLTLSGSGATTQNTSLAVTTLAGTAGSVALADAGNYITELNGLAATAGDLAVHTSSSLTVSAAVSASGNVTLSSEAAMQLAANLSGSTVRLDTTDGNGNAHAITQSAGVITAGTLTGVASTVSLPQANQIAALGDFSVGSTLSLTDGRALTVTGAVTSTAGAVSLTAQGITQTATSSITAAELDGASSADTVLDSRLNAISSMGNFTQSAGNFTLVTSSPQLSFGGGTTGQVTATTGSLTFVADRVGLVIYPAAGTSVSANAGLVAFAPFTAGRPTALAGTAIPANTLALSTSFLSYVHADTLTLGRAGYAGAISFGAANESLDLSAFRAIQIQTTGAVTQGLNSNWTVSSLYGTGGSISLPGALPGNNNVSSLGLGLGGAPVGLVATAGPLTVGTIANLTTYGPVSATTAVTLSTGRSAGLSIVGSVSAPTVTLLVGGAIAEASSGQISADTMTITAGSASLLGTNRIGTLTSIVTGDLSLSSAAGLTIAGGSTVGGTLTLNVAGAVTAGTISAQALTGSAGSLTLTDPNNRFGSLGPFTTTGGFTLVDAVPLTVIGAVSDPGAIALSVTGDLTLAGSLSSPQGTVTLNATGSINQSGGTIVAGNLTGSAGGSAILGRGGNAVATLAGFTTGSDFTLVDGRSLLVSAPVDPGTVTLRVQGDLTLASSVTGGTVVLDVTGAAVETAGGRIVADTLTGRAGSVAFGGDNRIGTLGGVATTTGFSLSNAGALTIAGPLTDGQSISVATAGSLTLAGDVSAPAVSFNAAGDITQIGGSLAAGRTLTIAATGALTQSGGGFAAGSLLASAASIDIGRGGAASIAATTGLVATDGTITLRDNAPLQISGTVSGRYVSITSTGSMVLTDGTLIRTDGQPTAAQLGAADASPGSNLAVASGADGRATLTQLGTVTVAPLSAAAATLRLDLPASNGTIALRNLQAGDADLVLNLGTGVATGTLVARNLTVLGTGGQATLAGTIRGLSGTDAAAGASLLPGVDPRYTLNGCAIALSNCSGIVSVINPGINLGITPLDVPSIFQPGAAIDSLIASANSAISSVIRPDILALDVLDLSVTRDRDDPTLLLPNISDKDY